MSKNSIYNKRYRARHPEKVKEWRKKHDLKFRTEHRERWLEIKRKSRIRNEEKNGEKNRQLKKARRLRLRFAILKRDNFTCQYCGRKSPEVILQIDHKFPKSRGGKSSAENYITACLECNVGKVDTILGEFVE